MKKLLSLALGAIMVPVVTLSTVHAAAPGQIEGGDIYRVKNVTKGTDFSDPIAATCGDTVQFKVRIHNPGPSPIDNVKVVATLPSASATQHVSRVTVSAPNAEPLSTSDTATVNLDKAGTLSYIAGSTELLGAHNDKISTLSDAITGAGVNIGNVGVSIEQKRFVQFQAKVDCPAPKQVRVCDLTTKKIITINEDDFNASKHSKNLADCDTPAPEKITVCDLTTHKVVTINKTDFDASKHTKDLKQCDKIMVCELSTKNIVTIYRSEYDATKHSTDLNKCAKAPEGSIKVCVIATKEIVTIKEGEFDASKHTRDLNVCAKVVTPVVPTTPAAPAVIAATGPVGTLATMLGLSGLAASATYFVRSRKANILG